MNYSTVLWQMLHPLMRVRVSWPTYTDSLASNSMHSFNEKSYSHKYETGERKCCGSAHIIKEQLGLSLLQLLLDTLKTMNEEREYEPFHIHCSPQRALKVILHLTQ